MFSPHSFVELYYLFQRIPDTNSYYSWLQIKDSKIEKQESSMRLFSYLNLFSFNRNLINCIGNFNIGTVTPCNRLKQFLYHNDGGQICLKDKGDKSDLTLINKEETEILAFSSKNYYKPRNIGDYDIADIDSIYNRYYRKRGMTLHIGLFVRDKHDFLDMISRSENSSNWYKETISPKLVYDWSDLREAFSKFKIYYQYKTLEQLFHKHLTPLQLYMHQEFCVQRTLQIKNEGYNECLWGHIPRSGKTYIMAGLIQRDSLDKTAYNVLLITTAPSETIEQYVTVMENLESDNFNLVNLNGCNTQPVLGEKNIIICSKQFLDVNNLCWLRKLHLELVFLDESHHGGSTTLAKNMLERYAQHSFIVFVTATYIKPSVGYNIDMSRQITWDLDDINKCKNITDKSSAQYLIDKHDFHSTTPIMREIIKHSNKNKIYENYEIFPELFFLPTI